MEKIAIIGTACLFPGADTPETYWENLVANKDSRVSADAEHMGRDPDDYFSSKKGKKDNPKKERNNSKDQDEQDKKKEQEQTQESNKDKAQEKKS